MALQVQLFRMNDQAKPEPQGTIRFDGEQFSIQDTEDESLVKRILDMDIYLFDQKKIVSSQSAPEEWLNNLHLEIRSPYLYATKAQQV